MTADSAPLASQDSARAKRRSVPRYSFSTSAMVTETSTGARLPARTSELGLNGCYIDTLEPFPVGTSVWIRIFKDREFFESSDRAPRTNLLEARPRSSAFRRVDKKTDVSYASPR